MKELENRGKNSICELIIPLPNESKQTYLDNVRLLMEYRVNVATYTLMLLCGAELGREDEIEKYKINLGHIGHAFLPGHQIRLEISSSAYPFFAPNPNTGNPIATDTTWRVAKQTVYHDKKHPSHLVLPIMPNK